MLRKMREFRWLILGTVSAGVVFSWMIYVTTSPPPQSPSTKTGKIDRQADKTEELAQPTQPAKIVVIPEGSASRSIAQEATVVSETIVTAAPKPPTPPIESLRKLAAIAASKVEKLDESTVITTETTCTYLEYRGNGPKMPPVEAKLWAEVMTEFHWAKARLLGWLKEHRKSISDATVLIMEKQISSLRIERPPTKEEPDLSWRGVGIYSFDANSLPILRLGGGFLKLIEKNKQRARFELVRLVAQGWAPCELKRADIASPQWEASLKCLEVHDQTGCEAGSYSESGWALSSTLADNLAPPGCAVTGLKRPRLGACLKVAWQGASL